jgi:hypothetical protein
MCLQSRPLCPQGLYPVLADFSIPHGVPLRYTPCSSRKRGRGRGHHFSCFRPEAVEQSGAAGAEKPASPTHHHVFTIPTSLSTGPVSSAGRFLEKEVHQTLSRFLASLLKAHHKLALVLSRKRGRGIKPHHTNPHTLWSQVEILHLYSHAAPTRLVAVSFSA